MTTNAPRRRAAIQFSESEEEEVKAAQGDEGENSKKKEREKEEEEACEVVVVVEFVVERSQDRMEAGDSADVRITSALVEALDARFGGADDGLPATTMGTVRRPHAEEEAVFAYLQADWEREEVMKLKDVLGRPASSSEATRTKKPASSSEAGGDEHGDDNEELQAVLACEYVAGLQEVYMKEADTPSATATTATASSGVTGSTCCCSSSSIGGENADATDGGEICHGSAALPLTAAGAATVQAPPRFASRLLNDRVFRARVSGRTALANDFVGCGTLLSRAIELLGEREELQPYLTESVVRRLIERWRSTCYLLSTPRLHRADLSRMCETTRAGKNFSPVSSGNNDDGSSPTSKTLSGDSDADETKQRLLRKVRRKVASSERREEETKRRAMKKAACATAEARLRDLVLHTVRVDVERYEALYKTRANGPPARKTDDGGDDNAGTTAATASRVLLSDVQMPSLAVLFQAKDPDCCGWMSFSHAMLALEEAQLFITPSEMFILVASLVKNSERNGALPWPQFLELIGASKPAIGGDWSQKSLLDTFQAWETAVQSRLLELQGFCGPDDVAKLMLCQPSVTAQFTKTHMRRYSVALSQHPVLQSPLFMRLASSLREKHERLATVLRAFDVDLRLAVNSADVKYAFQCVGVKLRGEMLENLCEVFRFPEGQSGREDDVYATGSVNAKFGVPFPDIDCERMLLSISPGLAVLHQDKAMDGIRSELFTTTDDEGNFTHGAHFDIDAILAEVSAIVYDKLLKLRASVLALPTPKKVRFVDLMDACATRDIDINPSDEELLLDFCRSDTREEFIDAARFVSILAIATTPDSVSYQAPPMQIIFEKD